MASLLHHHPAITHEEAVSYVHETGPWSRFLLTPWPLKSLVEGVVVLAVGVWAGIAAGTAPALGRCRRACAYPPDRPAGGGARRVHREPPEFASRYFAAVRLHGDDRGRAHPYLVLVVSPVVCALAGALGGVASRSPLTARLLGAAAGASSVWSTPWYGSAGAPYARCPEPPWAAEHSALAQMLLRTSEQGGLTHACI